MPVVCIGEVDLRQGQGLSCCCHNCGLPLSSQISTHLLCICPPTLLPGLIFLYPLEGGGGSACFWERQARGWPFTCLGEVPDCYLG